MTWFKKKPKVCTRLHETRIENRPVFCYNCGIVKIVVADPKCPNGHIVEDSDTYCERCGIKL